jgi:hypothetical protein
MNIPCLHDTLKYSTVIDNGVGKKTESVGFREREGKVDKETLVN